MPGGVDWRRARHGPRPGEDGANDSVRLAELKASCDLVEVAGRYVELQRRGRDWWGCCPFHADGTPSFKVSPERGRFHCFGCGADGDALDFMQAIENIDLSGAIGRLHELIGRHPQQPRPRAETVAPKPDRCAALRDALALWRTTLPISADSPAGRYLTARGCALPHPGGDLRYLEQHRHPSGHVGPALVALVTNAITVEPMTVHRTWVQPDGTKAPIERPRLLWLGLPKAGGVVRLWPDCDVTLGLCVAEGIESALTAARGFGLAWATLDKDNLKKLPVLAGLDAITLVADHDGDGGGLAAARECAARWARAGAEARVWMASTLGHDFNDFAQAVL